MKMKGIEGDTSVGGAGRYIFNLTRIISEDIIFNVDVDAESLVEMKTSGLRKEFSSDVESTIAAVRAFSATTISTAQANLTNLFRQGWGLRDNAKYSKESGSNKGEKKEDCICYNTYANRTKHNFFRSVWRSVATPMPTFSVSS
ncbi:hypothetical protein GOBAR_DD10323 [Gossypium barbadense]|nr:hypothetical protein GOBAR_DD10323 [Gossypium barbadense]